MTEREVFLNMIKRVSEESHALAEDFYRIEEDDNSITIINGSLEETNFYFNADGTLNFFE